jgi:PAS domain S-box-containing protein
MNGGEMTSKAIQAGQENTLRTAQHDVAALRSEDSLAHELQRTQRELEAVQERAQKFYDSAPVAYLTVNPGGIIVRGNAVAARLLGRPVQLLLGRPFAAFIAENDVARLFDHLTDARKYTLANCELEVQKLDGSGVFVQLNTSPAPTGSSDVLVVLTDISASKEAQVALQQRNRELEAERLGTMSRPTASGLHDAERLESLGLLAGGIAHDFNDLLVSVLGNAELLLLSEGLAGGVRVPLTLIQRAARSAAELTRQLLMYSGQGSVALAPVQLPRVVAEGLESLRNRIDRRVQLRAEITHEVPSIEADRGQILQLVTSLVSNALEAVDGSGVIIVRTRTEQLSARALERYPHSSAVGPGAFAVLQVQDSGPGIEPNLLPRVFEPFFTTKPASRGLGLSSALAIVHAHRGALRVLSKPGEGTTVEVALPLSAPRGDFEQRGSGDEEEWRGSGPVLLIDDDDLVRGVVERLLTRLGFTVTAANGGEMGVRILRDRAREFEFVLLDWMMPDLSGERVLESLRQWAPELPVIVMSGYSSETLALHDEHVTRVQKPMGFPELQEIIQSIYRARHEH